MPSMQMMAQKTDTIYHINGNILTGEFKKLHYGVISWKMDGMGTISLEEIKVNSIRSKKQFDIKMKSGDIYFGSFESSDTNRKVFIVLEERKELVNIEDIVEAYPVKNSFWLRTSGNFSLGANYSKGSNIATLAVSGNLDYRKNKSYFNIMFDENATYQGDSISSSKADLTFELQRAFKKGQGWGLRLAATASQNLELGTELRLGFNFTATKDITYNSWTRLYVGAGLDVSQETSYTDATKQNDLSGIFTIVWKVYKFSNPKVWVNADVSYIPYFTDEGRYRAIFNLGPNVSLFNDDFKVGFKFYYNYDSMPVSENSANDDYGINLMFTYSLH